MRYSNKRSEARFLAVAVLGLATMPVYAGRRMPPPGVGVKQEYLTSIGTAAAQAFLIRRLDDPKNTKYQRGLVLRLGQIGGRGSNAAVRDALIRFIDRTVASLEISGSPLERAETLVAIGDAMAIIGYRGEDKGIEYLEGWLQGDGRLRGPQAKRYRRELRLSAAIALGLSGCPKGRQALTKLRENPGEDGSDKDLMKRLDDSVSDSVQIEKHGIDWYFDDGASRQGNDNGPKRK